MINGCLISEKALRSKGIQYRSTRWVAGRPHLTALIDVWARPNNQLWMWSNFSDKSLNYVPGFSFAPYYEFCVDPQVG